MEDNYVMNENEFDAMAGLTEKTSVFDRLKRACKTENGMLMLINLDNFTLFKDIYGNYIANSLLQKVEEIIDDNTNKNDIKGCIGGDTFVVFIKNSVDKVAVAREYGNINNQLSEAAKKLVGEEMKISLGVSIGVVMVPKYGNDYNDLFQKADLVLSHIKQTGNRGCAFYSLGENDDTSSQVVEDDFKFISKGLDAGDKDSGALWLDYEYFSVVYRFLKRYNYTYNGAGVKMLITIQPVDVDMSDEDFVSVARRFGKVVNGTLRNSDVMMQSRKNQFFILLPEMQEGYVEKLFTRIRDRWAKTGYADTLEISYEFGIMENN